MEQKNDVVDRVREFNRFYTVLLGMLNRRFLDSEYSVTENRILFELSVNEGCSANFLVEKLHVDKSYMSRIIKSFECGGLVTKCVSPEDGRAYLLRLTGKGKSVTAGLIAGANRQIEALITPLNDTQRGELCRAMDAITELLQIEAADSRGKGEGNGRGTCHT